VDPATAGTDATSGVVVVIPAYNEAGRIGATVASAATLPAVTQVYVVDDGSDDATADVAQRAGATVVRHQRRLGKAAAMTTGARAALEAGHVDEPLLFLDADLELSASQAGALVAPVLSDELDMSIALLPPAVGAGGRGRVVRLARRGIRRRTGWEPEQPLSGQRCVRRDLFQGVLPLARGFGVETAMTIDAVGLGARVAEVPVAMSHRVTGATVADRLHRARQFRDVILALARRRVRRR
jgi:glycosyltransferase involved in cell wall biosynthesis